MIDFECLTIPQIHTPVLSGFYMVLCVEDENLPENSVAEVLQKGYVYKDGKVIRPAAVKVAN